MNDQLISLIKELKIQNIHCSEYRIKDTNSSILFYFAPGNLTSTSNRTPPICAYLKQYTDIFDFSTAKLYLDDKEAKAALTNNSISYIPEAPLEYGVHTVRLLVNNATEMHKEFCWSFLIEDEFYEYNFYYGIPHSHTSYSDGFGTPSEAYEKAKANGLDFLIITDHQGKLAKGNYNYDKSIKVFGTKNPKWELLKLEASAVTYNHNDFIALFGFELSTNFWGHINIINSEYIIEKKPSSLEELYAWLCTEDDTLISINHPHRSPKTLPFTHNLDNFVNLYEVGNGSTTRQYTRTEDNYYEALDNGWHIAAINGQDNHTADWGDSNNVTAVIAKNLSVNSLIDAIKLRRVYSTESKTLKLTVKGNNYWMGSIINLNKNDLLNLYVKAEDTENPIEKLQLITNRGKVLEEITFDNCSSVHWNLPIPITDNYSWYVVKVIQHNNKIAISSAIFIQNFNI